MRPRRPTCALLGVLAALCATAPAALAGNGGAAAPGAPDSSGSGLALSSRHAVRLGRALALKGIDPRAAHHQVLVQSLGSGGVWETVATASGDDLGSFRARWKPRSAGRYLVRAVLAEGQPTSADTAGGSGGAGQEPRTVTVYRTAKATWYGPGFYGKRTACGTKLTRSTLGVANRHLRCGTLVSVSYRGRTITVPVIDRGPFARGVSWDLTGAAAKQLGMTVTSRVRVAPVVAMPPSDPSTL